MYGKCQHCCCSIRCQSVQEQCEFTGNSYQWRIYSFLSMEKKWSKCGNQQPQTYSDNALNNGRFDSCVMTSNAELRFRKPGFFWNHYHDSESDVTASVSIAAAHPVQSCRNNVTFTALQPMADQRLLINGKRTEQCGNQQRNVFWQYTQQWDSLRCMMTRMRLCFRKPGFFGNNYHDSESECNGKCQHCPLLHPDAICAGTNVTFTATPTMAIILLLINGKRTELMSEITAHVFWQSLSNGDSFAVWWKQCGCVAKSGYINALWSSNLRATR